MTIGLNDLLKTGIKEPFDTLYSFFHPKTLKGWEIAMYFSWYEIYKMNICYYVKSCELYILSSRSKH